MHKTHTPLWLWFWAAYLVATHHPGISAKQLSRQLGLRYETAWLMLQKLRRAMVAPEREPLKREVEVDEFYLGGRDETNQGRRVGSKKALCVVAVEVRGRGSGRARLGVVENASWDSLGSFVKATTEAGAIVHTDAWGGYRPLARAGFDHRPRSQRAGVGEEPYLPRAHRAISNLRRGFTEPTVVPRRSTCPSTSTSSPSATTAAARRWPRFRRCSGSGPHTSPRPTAISPAGRRESKRKQPDMHSYPNAVTQTDGRLRFVVRGPAASSTQSAVLAFQRPF